MQMSDRKIHIPGIRIQMSFKLIVLDAIIKRDKMRVSLNESEGSPNLHIGKVQQQMFSKVAEREWEERKCFKREGMISHIKCNKLSKVRPEKVTLVVAT